MCSDCSSVRVAAATKWLQHISLLKSFFLFFYEALAVPFNISLVHVVITYLESFFAEKWEKKNKNGSRNGQLNGRRCLSVPGVSRDDIQNWFRRRWSRTVLRRTFFFFFLQPFSPTWDLAPAPSPSRLGLAEFLQHSNIHISAAEYELCTISSEKEFNDASLVQSASTNEEWFPLS